MTTINELAKEMKVTEADLRCLAVSVVNDIKKDGIVNEFLTGTDSFRLDIISSYIDHACKKMDEFVTRYLTNPEAREIFIKTIFSM